MDDLRTQAQLAYDRALAQKNLHERMQTRMVLTHAGGLWNCDQSLISMLACYLDDDEIVLLDANSIPRRIVPREFLSLVKQRHQEILNEWQIEYANLARIRTAKDV